jgi:hypothetical protein
MRLRAIVAAAALTVDYTGPIAAHHSNSAFELNPIETITGVVKEFKWSNPHVWVHVTVTDDKGASVEWALEGRPPGVLGRAGWSRSTIKPGETITVDFAPAKNDSPTGLFLRISRADGTVVGAAVPPQ